MYVSLNFGRRATIITTAETPNATPKLCLLLLLLLVQSRKYSTDLMAGTK